MRPTDCISNSLAGLARTRRLDIIRPVAIAVREERLFQGARIVEQQFSAARGDEERQSCRCLQKADGLQRRLPGTVRPVSKHDVHVAGQEVLAGEVQYGPGVLRRGKSVHQCAGTKAAEAQVHVARWL